MVDKMLWNFFLTILCITTCFLQAQGGDGYSDENRPYEFGFTIEGQQHRHEKKDKNGIIMGEYGFITADGVYHVTVYATDEQGRFKIISMKNIRLNQTANDNERQGHSLSYSSQKTSLTSATPSTIRPIQTTSPRHQFQPISIAIPERSCSHCSIPSTAAPQIPKIGTGSITGNVGDSYSSQLRGYNNGPSGGQSFGFNKVTNTETFGSITSQNNVHDFGNVGQNFVRPEIGNPHSHFQSTTNQGFLQSNFGQTSDSLFSPSATSLPGYSPAIKEVSINTQSYYEKVQGPPSLISNYHPEPVSVQGFSNLNKGQVNYQVQNTNTQYNVPPNNVNAYSRGNIGQISSVGPQIQTTQSSLNYNVNIGTPRNQLGQTPALLRTGFSQPHGSIQNAPQSFGSNANYQTLNNYPVQDKSKQDISQKSGLTQTGDVSKIFNTQGAAGAVSSRPIESQPSPVKPTLTYAQMRIVDSKTDVHNLQPGEKEGLPNGVTKNYIHRILYTFNYTVGFHGHHEEGYSDGSKVGYYYVTGRNGVRTRVDYVADEKGFRPKITQEVLDILSDEVPKPETEKDEKYGLKHYEFKWLYYPEDSTKR